jgi:threonine-phosphate decarboxylase
MAVDFPKKVVHGGNGKWQREKTRKNVLDFSASTNPFPPRFAWNPGEVELEWYPDDQYHELKKRIADTFHRKPEEICVGNGSIEIIRVFCSVVLGQDKTFFLTPPTFGEYELSALLTSATRTLDPRKADVTFVCNPNNPTGILQDKSAMEDHIAARQSAGGMLFCDEAFIALSDPSQSLVDVKDPHLFVLHSLTKSFSVPGIRFGFGFGDPGLIEKIETARSPWSVNSFAESYALEAFRHMDQLAESRTAIGRERDWLASRLTELGLHCYPSAVNYLLVGCNRPATPLFDSLARTGILVRDCTSFGLPDCIRIAVRTRDENRLLVGALTACLH